MHRTLFQRVFGRARHRIAFGFAGLALLLVIYTLLNGRFESTYDFMTDADHAIPLLPWTLPIYASLYLLAPVAACLASPAEFGRGVVALFIVAALCFAGFTLFPAAYPRPELTEVDSLWRPMLQWYYANDPPMNTFPSLHVGTAAVLAWMLRGVGRWWIWATWSTVIALTTLTTKQHFVADLIGGLGVASFAVLLVSLVVNPTTQESE